MNNFTISTDIADMDVALIHRELTNSYWAKGISLKIVETSMRGSLCVAGLLDGRQIAFARVITDRATFAYLADVFVIAVARRKGYGKQVMDFIMQHPDVQGLRRFMLATRDAHDVYKPYGFEPLATPDSFMEINHPDIYV